MGRALSLCALGALLLGCDPPQAAPVRCPVVRRGPVCELDEKLTFKLLINKPPQDVITVTQGPHTLARIPSGEEGERLVEITAQPGVEEIVVTRSRFYVPLGRLRIPVRQHQPHAALKEVVAAWHREQPKEALDKLDAYAQSAPAGPEAPALIAFYRGRIAKEQGDMARAEAELRQALARTRDAGLVSFEVTTALDLADLLSEHRGGHDEANQLLVDRIALIKEQKPESLAFFARPLAKHLWQEGQVAAALRKIEEGAQAAQRYGYGFAIANLAMLKADILRAMGKEQESREALDGALALKLPPCWRVHLLAAAGENRLLAWQARPWQRPAAEDDPRPALNEALDLAQEACAQVPLGTDIMHRLVQTELLAEQLEPAERWLRAAQRLSPAPSGRALLERQDLLGKVTLARAAREPDRPAQARLRAAARATFAGLADPLRQHAGAAEALEADDPAEALRRYAAAEGVLERAAQDMPLGRGRVGFLWQHEFITRQHVDLLTRLAMAEARPGERQRLLGEALAVMRSGRFRGLRVLTALSRLSAGSLEAIREKRRALTQLQERLRTAPVDEVAAVRRQLLAADAEVIDALSAALEETQRARPPQPPRFRPPAAGEALLACHGRRRDEVCLLVTGAGITPVLLPPLRAHQSEEPVQRLLLDDPAVRAALQGVERLRVLPGAIQTQDLHLLRLPRELLIEYSMDLPEEALQGEASLAAAAAPPRRGLLIYSDLEYHLGTPRPEQIMQGLAQGGFAVTQAREVPAGSADALQFWLGDNRGLGGAAGWSRSQIRSVSAIGTLVADIFTTRSPRLQGVVLLGCETGLANSDLPLLEGVSLAQAYLATGQKGRWVLATTRKVNAVLTARLAAKLAAQGAEALLRDPHQQLRRAAGELREELAQQRQADAQAAIALSLFQQDLGAYRIFVP